MLDWNNIFRISIIGLLVGVTGTGLGGFVSIFFRKPGNRVLSWMLAFSAGIMLSVVFMDLATEAFEIAPFIWGAMGVVVGALFLTLIDYMVPHCHTSGGESENARFIRTGLLLGIGIAMHNLPEGLAIGAGYRHDSSFGAGISLLIVLHDLPEGLAMSIPLCMGGIRRRNILTASLAAGIPTGIGAFLGALFGGISSTILALSLGFAAGAMLYITCDEMIPEAQKLSESHSGTYGIVIGALVGIAMSGLIH
ncbi:MAG TPA: ZIP family metal transporter [Firmicutes bacterium]|jgi:ZIP family zinc transporter|nr:ZIP family metal transporter [Bacillota bacterium]HCF90956.1 ZIP family metal transporter [Bacillota bacterium]